MTTATNQQGVRFWRPESGPFPESVWFGMATRLGGVSEGPYATLNLGRSVGDREDAVEENRARLRAAAGTGAREPRLLRQVHGATIVEPEAEPPEPGPASRHADGFLVEAGDPWVGISTADCAPVAVVALNGARGALLHCGWRGTRSGIQENAVRLLGEHGVDPATIVAGVGPCLQPCCFPIGPEVAAEFDPEVLRSHPSGQVALDLPAAIAASLIRVGVPREQIHLTAECTSCRRDLYFSHRRDRGITGRHWALLQLRSRSS